MKLYIESSAIFAERSGIGQFTKRLVETYHKLYPQQQIRLFGFKLFYRKFTAPIPTDNSLSTLLIRWLPGKIYTSLFKLGVPVPIDLLVGAKKEDVIIFPNFVSWPLSYNKKSISFVHDLSFILYGQYTSPPNRAYMMKFVPKTIEKSQRIITISESSKRDIIKHFKVSEEKISIVYPFTDTNVFYKRNESEISSVRKKYKLPAKYFLFVSNLEPRKNIEGILKAYDSLDKKIKDEYGLVLAGGKGWLNENIHELADNMVSEGDNIIRTGYVPDDDLPAIYSGATAFVFPSFYEGFGIPVLEAMACGVPVVTSNNSSLPEAAGNAGILVDAIDTKQIAKALGDLTTSSSLRSDLVKKGYTQIKKYTPESSAEQLQQAIQKLI